MASVSQSATFQFQAEELARIQRRDPLYLHEKIQNLKARASSRSSNNRSLSEWYFKMDGIIGACQSGIGWLVPVAGFLVTLGVEATHVAYIMSGLSFIAASLTSFRNWILLRSKAEEYKRVGKSFHLIAAEAGDVIYQNLGWDDLLALNKRLTRDYERAVEAADNIAQQQPQPQTPSQETAAVGPGQLQLAALPASGMQAPSHVPTPTPLFGPVAFQTRNSPLDVFIEPRLKQRLPSHQAPDVNTGMVTPAPASKRSSSSETASNVPVPSNTDATLKAPEV